jgi:hypothetical protein
VAHHPRCRRRSFSSRRRHDVWVAGRFRESGWNFNAVASRRYVRLVVPAAGLGHLNPQKHKGHQELCRRNFGAAQRKCTHFFFPLLSITRVTTPTGQGAPRRGARTGIQMDPYRIPMLSRNQHSQPEHQVIRQNLAGATGLEPAASCVTGRHLSSSVNSLLVAGKIALPMMRADTWQH